MTGGVKMEFPAETLDEAVTEATTRFRKLIGDETATLPWSTHFEFSEVLDEEFRIGIQVVMVRVEFDRKEGGSTSAVV